MYLILTALLVLILSFVYFRVSKKHLFAANGMFPGPICLPFLGNALLVFMSRHDLYGFIRNNMYFYRRSFRIWIGGQLNIILSHPQDVEKVWGSTEFIEKADQYDYLIDWIGRGLLTSYGDKWRKHRKMLTPAFHFNILEHFIEVFHKNGQILTEILDKKVGQKQVDVYSTVKLYALDNICECAMGTQLNAQQDPDSPYVNAVKDVCEATFKRMLTPWIWPSWIYNLTELSRRKKRALKVIHTVTIDVINKRMEELKNGTETENVDNELNIKRRKVFLDILLTAAKEYNLSFEDIQEEVDTFMFEGHDTISSSISFAMFRLAEHPEYQEKAYREQLEIMGSDDRVPTMKDLQSMKYLEKIIKETLRQFPSVPAMGRIVTKDVVLDSTATIPKGSQVFLMPNIIHEHPYLNWERPTEFYPDHFDLENAATRHPYQYLPFSAGPRNCIGMRFAMLEMKCSLSTILRNFKLIPAEPMIPLKLNVDIIMVSETGVHLQFEKRNNNTIFPQG